MKRRAEQERRVARATQLLLYKHHRQPGIKGWELRKSIGPDYSKVLELVDRHLETVGLVVKRVNDGEAGDTSQTQNDLDTTRFYVTFKDASEVRDTKTIGWRIDDLAGLAVLLSYITTHEGKAPRGELEDLLKEKMAVWKVQLNLDRYIRQGYLQQDTKGMVHLDWRTRAEVNTKALLDALLMSRPADFQASKAEPTTAV